MEEEEEETESLALEAAAGKMREEEAAATGAIRAAMAGTAVGAGAWDGNRVSDSRPAICCLYLLFRIEWACACWYVDAISLALSDRALFGNGIGFIYSVLVVVLLSLPYAEEAHNPLSPQR